MSDSTRIPHLLTPYLLVPPKDSLLLVSNVLSATSNWLLLRYLLVALKPLSSNALPPRKVVFVSFLRDWDFWRDGSRKLGLDIAQAMNSGKLVYIDGLTRLFAGKHQPERKSTVSNSILRDSHLPAIEATVSEALVSASSDSDVKPLLVLDGVDLLLAATQITATELLDSVMTWRTAANSTIISISADSPLLHTRQTPLEIYHAILTTSLIHQAYLVISLHLLSTGAAKDISGVLQASRGGAIEQLEDANPVEEKEVLYLVGGDGNVRVFERGSG